MQFNLQCSDDDNRSYRNVCKMSFISFPLAVIFIIRLFSTSAFRVPNFDFICPINFLRLQLKNISVLGV